MRVFMGHYVGVLERMVAHMPPDLVLVEPKASAEAVVGLCEKLGVACHRVRNSREIAEVIRPLGLVDVCIVASFGLILREATIKQCERIINFHPGDIERVRGRHPLPIAILNQHKTMAVTAHCIDSEAIDAGRILGKIILPIDYTVNYAKNNQRLVNATSNLSELIFQELAQGHRLPSTAWDISTSCYYPPLESHILDRIMNAPSLEELFTT